MANQSYARKITDNAPPAPLPFLLDELEDLPTPCADTVLENEQESHLPYTRTEQLSMLAVYGIASATLGAMLPTVLHWLLIAAGIV